MAKSSSKQPSSMSSALFGLPAAPKSPTPTSHAAKASSKGSKTDAKASSVPGKKG